MQPQKPVVPHGAQMTIRPELLERLAFEHAVVIEIVEHTGLEAEESPR